MERSLRASVELYGSSLRYVVLEHESGRNVLHQLGSCDFGFNLDEELREGSSPGHLDVIQEALSEVLAGPYAALSITLHPPTSFAFKTPLPETMSAKARTKHLKQEASLLLGMMPSDDVHVDAGLLGADVGANGEAVEWMHVSALRAAAHWRVSQMVQGLAGTDVSVQDSPRAVARLFREEAAREVAAAHAYVLLLGCYAEHVEYVLLGDEAWHHDTFSQTAVPEDVAYFAGLLMNRYGVAPEEVGRIFLYGPNVEPGITDVLATVSEKEPEALDPLALLHLDASEADGSFRPEVYAPCLGGAL